MLDLKSIKSELIQRRTVGDGMLPILEYVINSSFIMDPAAVRLAKSYLKSWNEIKKEDIA